ncbi:MAG: GHKL domain-containing protein [Oscillospiraceae bacterium]|nr:GHKL domain-containing protein [Oscillospiraceae bacterium]
MLQYSSSFIVYILEMLISYIFFSNIADKKISNTKCLVFGSVVFGIAAIANTAFGNSIWINTLTFLSINIVFALLCFHIKKTKAFFYSALLVIFSMALEYATIFIISAISDSEIYAYNSSIYLLLIEGIISKTLYFVTCLILARIVKKDTSNGKFPVSFYLFPTCVTLSLLAFWYICTQQTTNETNQIILAIVCVLLFGATVFLFITYQHNIEKENQYVLLQGEFTRLQTEKNYYDILEHQNQQLMLYAHDAKKHLTAIKDLNKNPAIDDYIKKMTDDLSEYSNVCHSGNMTLDVILNRYKTESELKGVKFTFDVRLNNLSFVDDFDLVAILGNLLDNALEAAVITKDKSITFETDRRNSYTVVIISNSCEQPPLIKSNQLLTTKKDKAIHGLGLKSVTNTIKKYNGDIDWEFLSDKKQFITSIMLQNKRKNLKS